LDKKQIDDAISETSGKNRLKLGFLAIFSMPTLKVKVF
jgi:hypothetical protein